MTTDYVLILTTFPSRRQAEDAAAELVRLRLVACAQVILACEVQVGKVSPRHRCPLRGAAALGQLSGLQRQAL